jgi:hypothetical protein
VKEARARLELKRLRAEEAEFDRQQREKQKLEEARQQRETEAAPVAYVSSDHPEIGLLRDQLTNLQAQIIELIKSQNQKQPPAGPTLNELIAGLAGLKNLVPELPASADPVEQIAKFAENIRRIKDSFPETTTDHGSESSGSGGALTWLQEINRFMGNIPNVIVNLKSMIPASTITPKQPSPAVKQAPAAPAAITAKAEPAKPIPDQSQALKQAIASLKNYSKVSAETVADNILDNTNDPSYLDLLRIVLSQPFEELAKLDPDLAPGQPLEPWFRSLYCILAEEQKPRIEETTSEGSETDQTRE